MVEYYNDLGDARWRTSNETRHSRFLPVESRAVGAMRSFDKRPIRFASSVGFDAGPFIGR